MKFLNLITAIISVTISLHAQENRFSNQIEKYNKQGFEKTLDIKAVSRKEIIETARTYLGTKHKMGGASKKSLDCSGLIYACFSKYGVKIPHNSSEIGRYGRQIGSLNNLKKGDLVFFHMQWSSQLVNHSGIYLGDGKFIHVSTSKGCIISNINSRFWAKGFLFGTRLF